MGWLGQKLDGLKQTIEGAPPIAFTYVPSITSHQIIEAAGEDFEPEECYVSLYVESLRLEQARRFGSRFNGMVYSMVSLAREGEPNAELSAVSKPHKLSELDEQGIGKVITVSKEMMAPTAYRGGVLSLELGLFSVKAGNVLSPMLDYVVEVSETAGISSVAAVKPFLPLVTSGMDLIAGVGSDTTLEVGLDTDLSLKTSGVSAIIARDRTEIENGQLQLQEDGTLLHQGVALDCGYVTFSFRKSTQKVDFGEIAELSEKFHALRSAIRAGKKGDARAALQSFKLTALTSPDLITKDAQKLVSKATALLDEVFAPTTQVGLASSNPSDALPNSLYDLDLYD